MREIKFRAWDKENKSWSKHPLLEVTTGVLFEDGRAVEDNHVYRPNAFVLMQFTGLKDKNGMEIYEGDILKTFDTGNLFEVIFDDKAASFKIIERSNTYAKNRKWMMVWDVKRREVIGNIYDNPELLSQLTP